MIYAELPVSVGAVTWLVSGYLVVMALAVAALIVGLAAMVPFVGYPLALVAIVDAVGDKVRARILSAPFSKQLVTSYV